MRGGGQVREAAGERRASSIVAIIPSFGERYLNTDLFAPYRYEGSDDVVSDGDERRARASEKKALQRGHILEAAREVFFRDGFVEANLDEVAQRAGVAKGTLYRYFENKGDLYVAVLARERRALRAAHARGRRPPGLRPAEQIRRLGRFYFEHWTRNPSTSGSSGRSRTRR